MERSDAPDPWAIETAPPVLVGSRLRWSVAGAVALGVVPTLIVLGRTEDPALVPLLWATALAVAWQVLLRVVDRSRAAALGVAAVAVAAVAASIPVVGWEPAVVLLVASTVAHGALVAWPLRSTVPSDRRRPFGLALAPLVLSQVLWLRGPERIVLVLGLLAIALALLELGVRVPDRAASLERGFERAVRALVTVVASAVLLVVALPLVYLPGAIVRAVRWVLRRPRHSLRTLAWRPRGIRPDDERRDIDRPFASTPRSLRAVRSVAGLILILLAVLGSLLWWEHLRSSAPEGGPPRMGVPEAPPG
jgi:hypothetical protein